MPVFGIEMKGKFVILKLGMFDSLTIRPLFFLFFFFWSFFYFELFQNKRSGSSNRIILNSLSPQNLCWVAPALGDISQLEYFSFHLHLSFSYLWVEGVGDPDEGPRMIQRDHGKCVVGCGHAVLCRTSFAALLGEFLRQGRGEESLSCLRYLSLNS